MRMTSTHFLPFPLSFPSPFCKWVYLLAELISLALSGSWLSCFLGRNVTSLFMDLGCLVPINYGKLFGELWRFVLEWFFFFFSGGLKRKPQGLQERFAGMGFSSGCGRLYEVTGQAFRLPTVVPLKGEKPKLTRAGVIPCKGQWDKSTLPVSLLEQTYDVREFLRPLLCSPGPRVLRQLQMLG